MNIQGNSRSPVVGEFDPDESRTVLARVVTNEHTQATSRTSPVRSDGRESIASASQAATVSASRPFDTRRTEQVRPHSLMRSLCY